MNESPFSPEAPAGASRDETLAALFANMVVQHSNMALIFLGQAPHPDTGEHILDLETAKMFIEQLEMLEAKTKGNLSKEEEGLLKQGLSATRMAFVQAVEHSRKAPGSPGARMEPLPAPAPASAPAAPAPAAAPAPPPVVAASAPTPEAEPESRKKFTKKY